MNSPWTTYNLLILQKETRTLVLRCGAPTYLPSVRVASHLRPALAVTQEVFATFGVRTFVLAWHRSHGEPSLVVVELLSSPESLPDSFRLFHAEEAASSLAPQQLEWLADALSQDHTHSNPYAQAGWLEVLRTRYWHAEIAEIEQLNCGDRFSLFRFSSDGRRLWFKGVGDPNAHEFAVTRLLSQYVPERISPVALFIDEWNAWITEEVVGMPLHDAKDSNVWSRALADCASIQIATEPHLNEFQQAGARLLRTADIVMVLPELMEESCIAMRAQTSLRARALSGSELRSLAVQLADLLHRFENLRLPDRLIHGDLGSGNVIVRADGTVFLDWAESYIGCPLVSGELLLASAGHFAPETLDELRREYVLRLHPQLRETETEFLVSIMPVLGPLATAIIAWMHNQHRQRRDSFWPVLRSLMRHTYRAAAQRTIAIKAFPHADMPAEVKLHA